jgi:hypothetical protein
MAILSRRNARRYDIHLGEGGSVIVAAGGAWAGKLGFLGVLGWSARRPWWRAGPMHIHRSQANIGRNTGLRIGGKAKAVLIDGSRQYRSNWT